MFVRKMNASTPTGLTLLVWVAVFVFSSIMASTFISQNANAAMSDNSRLRWGDAWRYCNELPGPGFHGMLWLSNQPDYYSEAVIINENDTFVNLSVRGAVNSCERSSEGSAWAIDVSVLAGPLWVARNEFWRGWVPGGNYQWSSQGEHLPATLDLRNVAVCRGSGGIESQNVHVEIFRRLRLERSGVLGGGVEAIDINVQRHCPERWNINGQSYIQNGRVADKSLAVSGTINATPGDRLNWYHDMRNIGPNNMNRSVFFNVDKSGFSNGWNGQTAPSGWASGGAGVLFVYEYAQFPDQPGRPASPYTLYDVTQDDVGNNLCQRIAWQPGAWNNGSKFASNWACARVPYNYNLTPVVSIPSSRVVEVGSSVTVDSTVNNSGPTKSKTTDWELTQMTIDANGGVVPNKNGGSSSADPCGTYFKNATTTCKRIASGKTVFATNDSRLSGDVLERQIRDVEDLPAGTQLCFALSVKPASSSSNDWQHSKPVCVTIGKKPKVQVLGGDLFAGRPQAGASGPLSAASIKTTVTQNGNGSSTRVYGSWVEYAAAATGSVNNFGSGAAYSKPRSTATVCGTSLLTLANTLNEAPCASGTTPGLFSSNRSMPDVASAFVTSGSTPALSGPVNLSSLNGLYRAKDNITITGGTIGKGRAVIINAPGRTVSIDGNITYDNSPMESIGDIPQVVIIADNIRIRGVNANTAVSQIDAWLVARGTLNTCYDANSMTSLTINRCNTRLTVNGPVMAKTLELWRTAGAGTGNAAGQPAEVFNLRPDAYLWGINQASGTGRLQSVYERELPPRF